MRAGDEGVPELVRRLVADGIAVRAVVPAVEQGLEDFFLELTQSSDVDSRAGRAAGGAGVPRMPTPTPPDRRAAGAQGSDAQSLAASS